MCIKASTKNHSTNSAPSPSKGLLALHNLAPAASLNTSPVFPLPAWLQPNAVSCSLDHFLISFPSNTCSDIIYLVIPWVFHKKQHLHHLSGTLPVSPSSFFSAALITFWYTARLFVHLFSDSRAGRYTPCRPRLVWLVPSCILSAQISTSP